MNACGVDAQPPRFPTCTTRADAGAAQLMGRKQPMINALARLGGMHPGELPKSVAAMGITGNIGKLFSTHPPMEERIAALQRG